MNFNFLPKKQDDSGHKGQKGAKRPSKFPEGEKGEEPRG